MSSPERGPKSRSGGAPAQRVLVADGAGRWRLAGAVLDDDQAVQARKVRLHGGHTGGELSVEHDGDEVGVVEEVGQLGVDVAVVDVDGDGPDLEGTEHGLDVLGAVQELESHVVAGADSRRQQVMGQSVGAVLELAVGQPPFTGDDRLPLRDGVGHQLEQISEIERRRWSCPVPSVLTHHHTCHVTARGRIVSKAVPGGLLSRARSPGLGQGPSIPRYGPPSTGGSAGHGRSDDAQRPPGDQM